MSQIQPLSQIQSSNERNNSTAESYRSQAAQCERLAQQEASLARRSELNAIANSLRMLAENEDWLAGAASPAGKL